MQTLSSSAAVPQSNDSPESARLKDVQVLVRVVYAALRGTLVLPERPLAWSNAFLKGQNGNTYIPYTLTIERARIATPTLAMYVYATPHLAGPGPAKPRPQDPEAEEARPPEPPEAAFEATYFVDLSREPPRGPYSFSRALSLPPGNYDVYVALGATSGIPAEGEPQTAGKATNAGTSNVLVTRQEILVPDFSTSGIATSTVIVAERVEALKAPLTPEQQTANPYTLGAWQVVPAAGTDFKKSDELSVIFFVYNAGLTSARKPDVTIEYMFHRRTPGGTTYFSKTPPQRFDASTMPTYDVEAGHQIIGGQAVPLATFPEGAYQLEINVIDRTSGARLRRNIDFAVRGS
jgi:hypothetical protein